MKISKRILIFASGNGSNFEAIVNFFNLQKGKIDVAIELLTDNPSAGVISRAKNLNIPCHIVAFDDTLGFLESAGHFDLYVLAGYMRILPNEVLKLGTFINIHPSLLPKYKGANAIKRAYDAKVEESGVTIHYVDENLDGGEIIAQESVKIPSNIDFDAFENLIHNVEHRLYPKTIANLLVKHDLPPLNVLIVGSGAREHVIAEKILESKMLNKLFLADANDGFKHLGENLHYDSYEYLAKLAGENSIHMAIIGPENPLADGIVDIFAKYGVFSIGSNADWVRLESSKSFAKKFMMRNEIETAKYFVVNDISEINNVLTNFKTPPVIKADGLAFGKGVCLPKSFEEAKSTAKEFLEGKFGDASKKLVVEEFLQGEEISIMSLWDGSSLVSFPPARDYKRLNESLDSPNTGGMGAICPVEISEFHQAEIDKYLLKLKNALAIESADFAGVIYSGLILTKAGVKVLEYNMRFGDPEIQAILQNLDSDLLEIFYFMKLGRLELAQVKFKNKPSICLVVAALGYPENPKKGSVVGNLEFVKEKYGVSIYFSGVKDSKLGLLSNGGRVLSICKSGNSARRDAYDAINDIMFNDKVFRKDIGL